jgi:hypothetical protein
MYDVLGIDWFNQNVLIDTGGVTAWQEKAYFILMQYSGLRDRKRTPEYPKGQEICAGDIVQFPILFKGHDGKTKETMVKGTVTFDREWGSTSAPATKCHVEVPIIPAAC